MKKAFLLLLAVALLVSALPQCAMGENQTLTVFRPMDANLQDYISDWNEAPYYQEMERLSGIHIEFISPTASAASETLNSLLISGDLPDVVFNAQLYAGGVYKGVLDGYFVNLLPYLEENAPEYWSIINGSDTIWRDATDGGDTVSAFYRIIKTANPSWLRLVLKKEVLEQLGVAEVPVTIADWDALFEKMKSAGITPYMLNKNGYEEKFIGAFDVRANFYQENGTVKYGQIQDGFRQYLELMHTWYDKGYISKDFMTASNVDTLFALGEIGTYNKAIVAAYNFGVAEGYTVLSTPYPRQTPDQFLHWESYKTTLVSKDHPTSVVAVSTCCKDIPLAVKWLNFLFTDEGLELANWGVKGLNYDVVDGKHQYLPTMWDYKGISQEGLNFYFKGHNAATHGESDTICNANLLKSPEATAIRLMYDDDPLLDGALYLPNISLTEEETEKRTSIMNDIDIYVNEMVIKFIRGTESLDNWPQFVKNVEAMRLDEAIAVTQAAYDRYIAITR